MKQILKNMGALAIVSLSLVSCQKEMSGTNSALQEMQSDSFKSQTQNPEGIIFYALGGNMLDKYSTSSPETLLQSVSVTGLQMNEMILGLDFRPATGELYALGSNSRLYTINTTTGTASFVATLSVALNGSSFGFDFNPAVDRIRIISNTGQNLRAHPVTGATIVDGMINPMGAMITAVAYDNNDTDPATGTELFALDAMKDLLYEIDPPNNGSLIDPLHVNLKLEGEGGFDIAPRNLNVTTDVALAIFEVNKKSTLFRIDVETGATKILAKYNKEVMYSAIAISGE